MNLQHTNCLDCSAEVTEIKTATQHKRAWLGEDINTDDWLFRVDEPALEEIHSLASNIKDKQNHQSSAPFPEEIITSAELNADQHIPHCRDLFARVKHTIDHGVGFAVIDRLPVDDYPTNVIAEVFWLLGQLIGQPVAQKNNGQMIYDVRDTGQPFGYGVRGSTTSVELNFHTDNAFGKALPEYVGLFCRHPAKTGGISRFCSLYALHDRIEQVQPDALKRLYQPMLYDRQNEHDAGAPPVTLAPYFSWSTDSAGKSRLRTRANTSLVRKGYEVADVTMDKELQDALEVVDQISKEPQFWYEAALEKGQVQYLNNRETGHYRSEFIDHEDATKKRHLFRLWHRNEGHPSYHGNAH